MSAILSVERVTGGYGDADIIHDVSMTVGRGEIVVVVGPNGAGKSTAMKAVIGLLRIRHGHVWFDGAPIAGWGADRIVRHGVGFVPQVDNVFREMTVHENLEMGAFIRRDGVAAAFERVYALFPDLALKRRELAGRLSGGQRQMVAMGRALMLDPRLLLLDEPTAGLSPLYMERIFEIVRDIRAAGVSVMLVEQHARQALALADRAYVLAAGRNRREGTGAALLEDPEIAQLFLGG
ncbi:ABC transporter ATP-binding protein [Rubrimonas cliftonensis]|uniref:Amino acid/amide ABC transporter ATP-binding protein 2, HAAT family n=1 Tax=Rubrimonas cliftonensis TaxID=89524 RepID=A0A1H4EEK9_9RHOB|nr:ABC transporter ATP-binding protein [Rubrimonas cliftonensis]SEA83229.1 amino acid/amide ABC transporter ATP-binding protein 2, HAAT family [Rubrimonas cliftonensis]